MQIKNQLRITRSIAFAIGLICITGSKTALLAQNDTTPVFLLREGVVVNDPAKEVYITTPQNFVQAVSVVTGESLWTSVREAKPLAVVNGKLICQAFSTGRENNLIIIQLDLRRKGAGISENSTRLPDNVKASFRQQLNASFTLFPKLVNGTIYLLWEYTYQPLRGLQTKDSAGKDDTAFTRRSGAFRVDGNTGRITAISNKQIPAAASPRSILLDQKEVGAAKRRFVSADGKHFMTSTKIAGDSLFNNYRWEVYDRASGNKKGELMDYRSYAPFYVSNMIIVYGTGPYAIAEKNEMRQVPLQLTAVDLGRGNKIWSKEILDPVYRGPLPPESDD